MGKTLKERFSAALIKGTTVATLLTAGGHAAAQTGSTQEKQEHKLEYSQNPHRSMEVPVFFQDKHLEMSQADFSKAMDKAEVDKAERVYLLKKFNQLMQSANGVTEKNFDWMMDIAVADGKLNPDKAQIISKATEQGEPSLFFSTEQLAKAVHESGVSEEKRQAFLENYMAAVDSELKITPRGLIKAFEKAGFTKQEVIKAGEPCWSFPKRKKTKTQTQQSRKCAAQQALMPKSTMLLRKRDLLRTRPFRCIPRGCCRRFMKTAKASTVAAPKGEKTFHWLKCWKNRPFATWRFRR